MGILDASTAYRRPPMNRRAAHAKRHRAGHPRPARRLPDDCQGQHAPLFRQLKEPLWAQVPAFSAVPKDYERRGRRTVKVVLAPAWVKFAGASQVAQLRRTVTRKGKKTIEVVYLITSSAADPATLAACTRGH